jgi:elongation factor 1-alpha
VEESDKLVSFVDTVGHKPWLRTTIRGLVGQKIDYGVLTVAADDGPTKTTKEHLGLLIATDLPVITVITKTDMVSDERVNEVQLEVEKILRQVGRNPLSIERHGVQTAIDEIREGSVPILKTSAVDMNGLDKLDYMFKNLPPIQDSYGQEKLYIDKTYNIEGVGPVVSGTVQSGQINSGDEMLIGPMKNGEFRKTKIKSIEIHYYDVDKANAGQIASLAVSNVETKELERGMVLLPLDSNPKPVREFEAEVMVLNHPTKITTGYEPVVHLETISETVIIETINGQLMAGDKDKLRFKFKFNGFYVEEGQKFVFREGDSKGVGKVTKVIK